MFGLGPHAGYILGAYSAAIVIVGSLIGWVYGDTRIQQRQLRELEARGVRRRSEAMRGKTPEGAKRK